MECRKFELILVSADDLPDVRSLGIMKVYAEVTLKGESKATIKSPIDRQGETNPRWNFSVDYTISESTIQKPGVIVVVKLYCKRTFGDRFIGQVNVPVKSLFDMGIKAQKIISYGVGWTPNGRLNILYSFGEKFCVEKPSGCKTALGVGFLVLIGGMVLLFGESDDGGGGGDEREDFQGERDDGFEVDDDGEIFYDTR